jgi:hypothetical protein
VWMLSNYIWRSKIGTVVVQLVTVGIYMTVQDGCAGTARMLGCTVGILMALCSIDGK